VIFQKTEERAGCIKTKYSEIYCNNMWWSMLKMCNSLNTAKEKFCSLCI